MPQTFDFVGLRSIMHALFEPYRHNVTDVNKIIRAMIDQQIISSEDDIVNDHIAFRTLGIPNLGIKSFEKIFLQYGYVKQDYYAFEEKKLNAYWYAPPLPEFPRIFISELRVNKLSNQTQTIIDKYTKHITSDPIDAYDLEDYESVGHFFYQPLWELPTLDDYNSLMEESEYAAWVIYNRYYLNHYTISVHELPEEYNTLESFNAFLESIGITLNTSGGKIKVSRDGLLKQSSTVSKMIDAEFADGQTSKIAGSYVEFAERGVLPEYADLPADKITRDHRRDGFESANADKIFESTYLEQTVKG